MGVNYSCTNCCIEKELYIDVHNKIPTEVFGDPPDPMEMVFILPQSTYAKPVNSIIDMTNPVRRTYKEQRVNMGGVRRRESLKGNPMQAYYLFEWNAYYEGEWKEGLPHGQGRLHFDNGSVFEGTLNKGVIDCDSGLYIFPSGGYFKGSMKRNKANGEGTLRLNEIFYAGSWQDNLPDGQGSETYEGSYKYKGEFKRGQKHGDGIFVWPDLGSYEGSFQFNKFHGSGLLRLNTYTYQGQFFENKKQGFGRLVKNGDVYEGQFMNDMKEGRGNYTWKDGSYYVGSFHHDVPHGLGKLVLPDGTSIEGEWQNGQPPAPK